MRIHISIKDNIDPETAVRRVAHVISGGRKSKYGKLYCYLTTWSDGIAIQVRDYRKSDCFVVFKSTTYQNQEK